MLPNIFSNLVSKQKDGKCGYNRETKDVLWQNQKLESRIGADGGVRNKKPTGIISSRSTSHENSPFQETHFINKPFSREDNFHTSTPPSYPNSRSIDNSPIKEANLFNQRSSVVKELNTSPSQTYSETKLNENSPFHETTQMSKMQYHDCNTKLNSSIPPSYLSARFTAPPPLIHPTSISLENEPYNPILFDHGVPPPTMHTGRLEQLNGTATKINNVGGNVKDVPVEVHIKCLEVLRDNPMGIPLTNFQLAYEGKNDNVPLNYTRYGYRNLKDCLSTMVMSLTINEVSRGNFLVSPLLPFLEEWASQIKARQKALARKKTRSDRTNSKKSESNTTEKVDFDSSKSAFTSNDVRKHQTQNVSSHPQEVMYSPLCDKFGFP